MTSPFDLASQMVGKREIPDRAVVQEYLKNGGANLDPATTAWCAAFVNSTLKQSGGQGTGSNLARSFLGWGQPVSQPQRGDVAVFSRGDPKGPYGHVGFFDSVQPDGNIRVLGGNQGNAVSVAAFPPDQLLGYRRAGDTTAGATPASPTAAATGPEQPPEVKQALADIFTSPAAPAANVASLLPQASPFAGALEAFGQRQAQAKQQSDDTARRKRAELLGAPPADNLGAMFG